jgi:hypothetical protein
MLSVGLLGNRSNFDFISAEILSNPTSFWRLLSHFIVTVLIRGPRDCGWISTTCTMPDSQPADPLIVPTQVASTQLQNGPDRGALIPHLGKPDTIPVPEGNIESQESSPSASVLYRYLHKTDEGDIIDKEESPNPIKFRPDDSAEGLTAETVLEILTTRISRGKSDTVDHSVEYGTNTVMKIHSIHLVNALREVITYYPELNLRTDIVIVSEPYVPLVHYMKELEDYKTIHPEGHDERYTTTTNEHIDVLLGFLDRTLGSRLRLERELHQRPTPLATFENLWMLFRPGQDVYLPINNGKSFDPMVVAEYSEGDLACWNLKYESGSVRPMRSGTIIPWFDGEKEITALSAFPRKFHPEDADLESRFIERGKKYWSLCEPSYQEHTGQTLRSGHGRDNRGGKEFSPTTVCNSISEDG